ncbi:sigma-70 family RNA polymerase sigma factor [Thermodesulfobacteriota bacterium]
MDSEDVTILDKETIKRLLGVDWDMARAKAIKQAIAEVKIFDAIGLAPPDPEDLVNEACCRLFSGSRSWDYERYPDLGTHLTHIIRSIASHERRRLVGRNSLSLNQDESEGSALLEAEAVSSSWAPRIPNPEELMDLRQRWKDLHSQLAVICEEDEEVGFVVMCFEDEKTKPREIGTALGWDVQRVNNALKRIRRKLRAKRQNG